MIHEQMAQCPSRPVQGSPEGKGRDGGGQHATAKKTEGTQQSNGVRRETASAGEGGSVTALAEMREWEAERVAGHVAD